MVITLEVITDIYSQPDKLGKRKLIKRNVKYNKTFDTNFLHVQHLIDTKGNLSKKYCIVLEGENSYKVNHKFDFVEKLIKPLKIKGFR